MAAMNPSRGLGGVDTLRMEQRIRGRSSPLQSLSMHAFGRPQGVLGKLSAANFMCSRSDRTAWRADGASGDRLAGSQRRSPQTIAMRHSDDGVLSGPQLSLTMRFWRSVVVLALFGIVYLGFGTLFCGTWTIRPRIAGSSPLDANGLHHLAPLLGFIGDELSEVDRRAREGRSAQHGQPRLDLGIGKDRFDLIGERLHHIVRYCFCLK